MCLVRNKLILVVSIFVAALIFVFNSSSHASTSSFSNQNTDRLIVKFRSIAPKTYREKVLSDFALRSPKSLKASNAYSLSIRKEDSDDLIEKLERNLLIEYVEPDYRAQGFVVPNDPLFSNQWALDTIQAPSAWDVTSGSGDVDIAVVDTGINGSHPDLNGKVAVSVDCRDNSSCPFVEPVDVAGHGTHVAGIISANTNNATGVAGTIWNVNLMSVKALDDDETGYYSWIADGIVWATDHGAEVINLSLGGRYYSRLLRDAVEYAWDNGVVVVAAAGNSSSSAPTYPAYYSDTIAVGATDQGDNRASFSSYGRWVDVAAPGVNILSTYKNDYEYFSGTSMSTSFVSGVAGLIFSQNPSWSNSQVRVRLEETADDVGHYFDDGRINACRVVGCDVIYEPTPTSEPIQTNTPTPTFTPTPTNTPTSTPTNTPTPVVDPSPTPTPVDLPWWCRYVPWHRMCQ